MYVILFYGSILASMILYSNTMYIIKKIKNNESIEANTVIGSILFAFIIISIFTICSE